MKIDILYEDTEILVCRKDAGIPVETARVGQTDLAALLRRHCLAKGEKGEIHIVHRLDQPVEGVMVFAKTSRGAADLTRQMQNGGIGKEYLALVCGIPEPERGVLTDYLLRDGRTNCSKVVPAGTKGAKQAELSYEVLEIRGGQQKAKEPVRKEEKQEEEQKEEQKEEQYALVRIVLKTGRHHQIRVQLSHRGYPILGDQKYGGKSRADTQEPAKERANDHTKEHTKEHARDHATFPALCAVKLSFLHPVTGTPMEYRMEPRNEAFKKGLTKAPGTA